MTGHVEWPQLIAIVSVIIFVTVAVSGFACTILWMAWKELQSLKSSLEIQIAAVGSGLGARITQIGTELDNEVRALDARIRAIEAERLLGNANRQDFIDFRDEVRAQFKEWQKDRQRDMRGLHNRLNDLLMLPPTRSKPPEEEEEETTA